MTEIKLELASEGGEPVSLSCRLEAVQSHNEAGPAGESSPWRIEGELAGDRIEALQLVTAAFEDGRKLAVASLRPRGVRGHDRDAIASLLVEDEEAEVAETLLSIEYDADGLARRLGIELWMDPESAPLRVAADRTASATTSGDGIRREATPMAFRLQGEEGSGVHELLRPY